MNREFEILSPAGSYECLKAAIIAGADAVYVGGTKFGARAFAENFDVETMLEAIDYVHLHGKKIYLTINTLIKEHELQNELYEYLLPYYERGIDAVIVQDIGVLKFVKQYFPDLPIHASTQMTVTNVLGAKFLEELGVERVVTARELHLDEIRNIKEHTSLEIESFVHGALCYCYSGQCLYSSMLGGRSGNRGQCAQPCRLPYRIHNETKQQYLLSLKDICTLEYIPELIESGIYSFKIEGRMKKPEYVALVTAMYRKYVDLYQQVGKNAFCIEQKDKEKLLDLYNRGGFHSGYYQTYNGREMLSLERPNHAGVPVLQVVRCEGNRLDVKAINQIHPGDVIELPADNENYTFARDITIDEMFSITTHKRQKIQSGTLLFRVRNESLLQEIRTNIIENNQKILIDGYAHFEIGKPAKLVISHKQFCVEVFGEIPQSALNQPITEERIEKQLRKTGNTAFQFDSLKVHVAGDLFVPMYALNELRRIGIVALENEILKTYRREQTVPMPQYINVSAMPIQRERYTSLYAYVEEVCQLQEVIQAECVTRIYVDANAIFNTEIAPWIELAHHKEKELYLAMPYVFREKICHRFEQQYADLIEPWDGMLIRNLESYEFLSEHSYAGSIVVDHNVYQFNSMAKEFWKKRKVDSLTAPFEQNYHELKMIGMEESELVVYGHYPMMISTQCIQKTTRGCSGTRGRLIFDDRYQKSFIVKNECAVCYNVIYNTNPVVLIDQKQEVFDLAPKALRLHFTVEEPIEVKKILALYEGVFLDDKVDVTPEMEFTRGHFKRGVK